MVRSNKQLVNMTYCVLASFSPTHLSHRSIRNFIIDIRRLVFTFDNEFNMNRRYQGSPAKISGNRNTLASCSGDFFDQHRVRDV